MGDTVVRSMTDDGAFRVMVTNATETIRESWVRQEVKGDPGLLLGELIVSAVLFRETMAPSQRVQVVLAARDESGRMIADSHPEGWARGFVQGDSSKLMAADSTLTLMRTLYNGSVQRGTVEIGEARSIAEAFSAYMLQSEQTHAVVGVSVVGDDAGELSHAAGYLVQLLPEAPEKEQNLAILTERLDHDFRDFTKRVIEFEGDPQRIVDEMFYGMPHTALGNSEVRFGCHCSMTRVLASLATVGKEDLQSMVDEGKALEMNCEHCGQEYRVQTEQLRGLLAGN